MLNEEPRVGWSKVNTFLGNSCSNTLTFHRSCPICGSLQSRPVLELQNFQFYSDSFVVPKRVDLREHLCLACSALYLNPCYSNYGFQILFEEAGQSYGSSAEHTNRQIEWLFELERLEAGYTILDVGCYEGGFLSKLPPNLNRIGVDIDGLAIERGRELHEKDGISLYQGDFETFEFEAKPPETITMFHVLEHLARPVEVLEKLGSISGKNTRLVVEVPTLENAKTNDINGFFSIQHMTHFSCQSVKHCLHKGGWEIETTFNAPDYNGYRVVAKLLDKNKKTNFKNTNSYDDVQLLVDYMANWYESLRIVETKLKHVDPDRRLIIWGGGAHTEFLYQCTSLFQKCENTRFIIVDSDPLKQGKSWRGINIYSPDLLKNINWSNTDLLISSYGGQEAITSRAEYLNVPIKNLIRLYDTITSY